VAAEVYFVNMRAKHGNSLLQKVEKLFFASGMVDCIAPNDLVALKVHFGEKGNTGYIRPQFVRKIVDKVKEKDAKPFITDGNTLYVGSRANAVDHLQTAIENGWDYSVVNAPLVISDGLTGKDYVNIEINQKYFKDVKIGAAAYHADAILGISHFKGHEAVGFGGAIKNIGMGFGSRSGKQNMHSDVLPKVSIKRCISCKKCSQWCPSDAIFFTETKATINPEKCIGCGECVVTCPTQAIAVNWKTEPDIIQEKIAEYALGVLQNKKGKTAFMNFLMTITPDCDCFSWSDAPIVSDIGILASTDPVAIDQASFDLVNEQLSLSNSRMAGKDIGIDKFKALHGINGEKQLEYAESIGIGTRKYKLISLD
jgi:uncharacterized Fe-S center protein